MLYVSACLGSDACGCMQRPEVDSGGLLSSYFLRQNRSLNLELSSFHRMASQQAPRDPI